jgi:hypothetical protein
MSILCVWIYSGGGGAWSSLNILRGCKVQKFGDLWYRQKVFKFLNAETNDTVHEIRRLTEADTSASEGPEIKQ